ncbi:invasion associated locus B family protein [Bradyrhizobium sp. Ai1a-2]|uniref:invasion associated locus B family protein n=1 Tax=Bradyrhizobium sp. Ai1a-2 TaxID=196490 RepID=UPI00040701B4|nr:invasion associated locus B family protein [Bradyrhizobium sp. Ai1a-2]
MTMQPRRPFPILFLGISLILSTMTAGGPANAQQTVPAGAQSGGAEIAPRGQREARDIKFGDWEKVCFKPGGAKMVCRTMLSGTFKTGQTAVRVYLTEREDNAGARLQLFLPVGLYLPAGATLTVDQGTTYRLPFTWCLTNTCIAGDLASENLLRDMDTGQKLFLQVVDTNLLSVRTALPLDRFATARKGAPARVFEQDIDE